LQDKAEDAGGLTPVKDDNEVMRFPDCRTFLSIFGNCSKPYLQSGRLFVPLPAELAETK